MNADHTSFLLGGISLQISEFSAINMSWDDILKLVVVVAVTLLSRFLHEFIKHRFKTETEEPAPTPEKDSDVTTEQH